ncbi:hypothetical protein C1N87_33500 (plasmid) [Priestia aryabhattai]
MNILNNVDLFLLVTEMVQTISSASPSDLAIAAIVFVLLKCNFNFELKISVGTNSKQANKK